VTGSLAYAAQYAHHASGGLDWLLNMVVHGVVYAAISRVIRSMTMPEVLLLAAVVVVAFLTYQRRA
jgi:hypothetical protein